MVDLHSRRDIDVSCCQVQLRYTWLISQNILEVKVGDKFGLLEVKEANENTLLLYNKDAPINLGQNAVIDIAGGIKFKVADSSTALRFYPFIEQTIQSAPKVELNAANATTPAATSSPAPASTSTSLQAAAQNTVQTTSTQVKTESPPQQKLPGFTGLYAAIGLVATAYFVLRKNN